MIKIAPSILAADFSKLGEIVSKLKIQGADLIHLDIMDGHFVPNISFGPDLVKSIRMYTDLEFDVHLMIENPDFFIERFISAGADSITVHFEACKDINKTISIIKSFGKKAGIALNPSTQYSIIENIIDKIDMVLVMSVNPGFGGQSFIESSLDKIRNIKRIVECKKSDVLIEVDGGINFANIADIKDAGADIAVAGTAIFKSENISETILKFKN